MPCLPQIVGTLPGKRLFVEKNNEDEDEDKCSYQFRER
jgi:hypothetical protein